ncbi:MAG: uroporphyrinogen decarboxylase family protein [Oscillospiraceae bacterium]|nr:uroporphyrinogen decarboxylase family protein [Oscillospiraceae bacterium]
MPTLTKARETMTSRERVVRTFNRERTDRVTIGYDTNPAIHKKFCAALGLADDNHEALFQAIGVDYRGVNPPYVGPQLFPPSTDDKVRVNTTTGSKHRWVENNYGGYWDLFHFPLKGADDEAIAAHPVTSPDQYDYDAVGKSLDYYGGKYGIYFGSAGMPDIINGNSSVFGMEDLLCHLALGNEAALSFINRRADSALGVMERTLERYKGRIDFIWMGEDLGTQIAPMVSLDLYRKHMKPIHKRFCDLAGLYGLPVIVHTCGSSSWAYEDFIEIGVSAVDTLQPEAVDMGVRYLKERYGGRLGFRGCISTAGPLAYGTADEVEAYCAEVLGIMMEGGGYHFAPTHAIQDNSPVENVVRMYQSAHTHGVYT